MNNHVTVLEIDANALMHNLDYFRKKLNPSTKILAVVKAFGYGSDGVKIASFLQDKVAYFGVAYTHEGIALRKSGIQTPILVLHPQIQNFKYLVQYHLEPAVYSIKLLTSFLKFADEHTLTNYPVHLKFNTGLNRLGLWHNDIPLIWDRIKASDHIKVISVFSHLAASEDPHEKDFTIGQIDNFKVIVEKLCKHLDNRPMIHTLNTSGVINYPEAQFDMVRIGIGLYGFGNDKKETSQLKNTHKLSSVISQIHKIEPGETVGYNRAFAAKNFSKIATIPIGHADGISRKSGHGKGYVTIQNQKAPIVGNVCMDMIMVDISKIDCKEGDKVIIFDTQETILHFANISDTISYEILTAISQRAQRVLIS
ncbi:MAG: alanine racemase [Flavobacteriaceae bacterium]|nr:MAG: alanine racemase [Flavobacteriaceae bacterium]